VQEVVEVQVGRVACTRKTETRAPRERHESKTNGDRGLADTRGRPCGRSRRTTTRRPRTSAIRSTAGATGMPEQKPRTAASSRSTSPSRPGGEDARSRKRPRDTGDQRSGSSRRGASKRRRMIRASREARAVSLLGMIRCSRIGSACVVPRAGPSRCRGRIPTPNRARHGADDSACGDRLGRAGYAGDRSAAKLRQWTRSNSHETIGRVPYGLNGVPHSGT